MRIVTGYLNGKPQYRDEGPAFARVQGHGGAALGQAHTTFVVHQQHRATAGTLTEAERLAHRRIPEKELRGEALLKKRRYRARP